MRSVSRVPLVATLLLLSGLPGQPGLLPSGDAEEVARIRHYEEKPGDPPARYAPRNNPLARSFGMRPQKGGFVSVQVNVDGLGQNILGDAANEPSIAVNRANPNLKIVGWRQFNSVTSNFREAGWGYTVDGGASWTFPGSLEPGIFRSDPVLDTDAAGNVFYQSLYLSGSLLLNDVWKSLDGGQSWSSPVAAFGGDKNWITVDKSGSIGDGHVYATWQIAGACCGLRTFSRSANGAASFEQPVQPERVPLFGTSAVGPDGEVYVTGIDGRSGQNFDVVVVAKTTNARDAAATPTFSGLAVDLGGSQAIGGTPNPQGLLGQINVAVDPSDGPTRGHVYVLGSVTRNAPGNPADVNLIRSEDGGETWSAPVRVHGDPESVGTWHWFGALGVAPSGRVDAVWYDTRNSTTPTVSEVFYAYSNDGGRTWFGDIPVTPAFDSTVGWPRQNKLGDYIQLISDVEGADLAYAATFNGEQDVYYLRLFPDCNGNGISDGQDVNDAASDDCNGNFVPDECEIAGDGGDDCNQNDVLDACDIADGASDDCDGDGVADECQPDCNQNGRADACDLADATSVDCAGEGIPDECEPDCNRNGTADSCDLFEGTSGDCNDDGVLDECEPDCDRDGVPDPCATAGGFAAQGLAGGFGPAGVLLADLDGDDDPDLVTALLNENRVAWSENLGGGAFGPLRTISTAASGAFAVVAADLDGDLDADILSVSISDDKLAWYENLDGRGTFGAQRIISTLNDGPVALAATDLDGDLDVDVAVASINDHEVAWYENLGGGAFGTQQLLAAPGGRPRSVVAADLDHDGDNDLLIASEIADTVAWYENLGGGAFGARMDITDSADGAWSVAAADLDGDGDRDVISASSADDTIAWHANDEGTGMFGARQLLATDRDGARLVVPVDLDGDGDVDVVSAAFAIDTLAWHENDGGGGFAAPASIANDVAGINGAAVADVDRDGDVDAVSAALLGNTIALHENTSDDCNGNAIPDSCEPDCDGNGVADDCDLRSRPAGDCDATGVPDTCETDCAADCDGDGDGCLDDADTAPADPASCGDTDGDGCDDCAGGWFDPAGDGTNGDTDGICDSGDCDAARNAIWRAPGPVAELRLEDDRHLTVLDWQRPTDPGALALGYDVLRSENPADFVRAAACIVTNGDDPGAVDLDVPAPGQTFHYLVRGANDCPSVLGSLGADSTGASRSGRRCTPFQGER